MKGTQSQRRHSEPTDSRLHLRAFLTTIKNHQQASRRISGSLDLELSGSPPMKLIGGCSLPEIISKRRTLPRDKGLNQFEQHIICNYLNAHLKVRPGHIPKKATLKKHNLQKIKKHKLLLNSENSTNQEAELETLREGRHPDYQSIESNKNYSLKEEPMKHYVKQREERKKREWKEKSPFELETYFYMLKGKEAGIQVASMKKQCDTTNKIKVKLPPKDQLTTFIKHYQPKFKEIRTIDLIKKQGFTVDLADDYLYFGEYEQGKRNGQGILIRSGYLFEGFWNNGSRLRGYQLNQTGEYTGTFKNERKEGKGQFKWGNGQLYSGEWLNGRKHGVGMWVSLNGDSYMGEWKNGIVEGEGIHKTHHSQSYEGCFKNFLKHGWGKEKFPNGDQYEGYYVEGLPHGQGVYKWSNGVTYEGDFFEGYRHGIGLLVSPKGFSFNGQFVKQFAEGNCEVNYGNGHFFCGQLKKGKRNGKGTLRQTVERRIYQGYWKDDQFVTIEDT